MPDLPLLSLKSWRGHCKLETPLGASPATAACQERAKSEKALASSPWGQWRPPFRTQVCSWGSRHRTLPASAAATDSLLFRETCKSSHLLAAYGSKKPLSRCGENELCPGGQGALRHSWGLKEYKKSLYDLRCNSMQLSNLEQTKNKQTNKPNILVMGQLQTAHRCKKREKPVCGADCQTVTTLLINRVASIFPDPSSVFAAAASVM